VFAFSEGVLRTKPSSRWPFNLTLIVAGVFATAAGGANTFTQLAVLIGLFGFGAGGG
jgi:hypothetical protein